MKKLILALVMLFATTTIFADDISGYSLMELNVLFSDVSLNGLKKLKVDGSKMGDTSLDYRLTSFKMSKQDSAEMYCVANLFLPGIGSALQGDYNTTGTTIAINVIGWIAFYTAYGSMLMNDIGNYAYDNSYSDTGESPNLFADSSMEIGIMVTSAAVMGIWNIIQIFKPLSYEKSFNKELKKKLQVYK